MNLKQLKIELKQKSSEFLNEKQLEVSERFFDELSVLTLDKDSYITGFHIYTDIKDPFIREKIEKYWGINIIKNIELLNRISNIQIPETNRKIMSLRKLFVEITDDLALIFVKLAERLFALKEADKNNSDNAVSLSEECLYLYAPIAQKLGISKIYSVMEDISFKHLYPVEYKRLEKAIERRREEFHRKLSIMSADLQKLMSKNKINAKYQARVKRLYSIFRKIKNKGVSIDKIFDLLALRVVTDSPESCYLALGVVHSQWVPIEGRFRDWITYPKQNGYRSIQTTVHTRKGDKFEIQIRTEEMHKEAEYGSAAHWAYKQGASTGTDWIGKLKEFLDQDEYFENPHELFDMLKSEMKRDRISVLTPKGDIVSLSEGSTPLDFAFSVHTSLGYKTTGARINGKFAKLKSTLNSGDVVDIITNNNATPSRDWLDIVKSTRARSKILRWFKKNEKEILVSDGKKKWEKLTKRYAKRIEGFVEDKAFRNNIAKMGHSGEDDFFYAIANGAVNPNLQLLKKVFPKAFEKIKEQNRPLRKSNNAQENAPKVKVEDLHHIETKLAKCCHPIKGEPIIAYVTKSGGIKIHKKDCPYVQIGMIDPLNIKKAEWISKDSSQNVRIKVFGYNFNDILTTLVNECTERKINIVSTDRIQSKKGIGIQADLEVKDINQLNVFSDKLKKKPTVDNVKIL